MIDSNTPIETLDVWSQHLQTNDYAAATVKRYVSAVRSFLAWHGEQEQRTTQIADLTPIALIGYRWTLQQIRATATTNLHVAALRSWCQWMTDRGLLNENPAVRLKTIGHVTPDAPNPLSDKAVNALLRAARSSRHGKRNYAICQLLLQTGMRIGECQSLLWQDIDCRERKGTVLIRAGKGNKARAVPLNGSARSALAEYVAPTLECDADSKSVAVGWTTISQERKLQPLWVSQKGRALSTSAMWRMFITLVADCAARGLVPETTAPHVLRHTFAHRYLDRHPGDLIGLARILGHESLETTKVYLRLTTEDLAQRVEEIPINAYE
jgi:site-specific recombinase XerD